MALLPDPTTAASERSSVKKRLTGSRRRGPGINNRHRSRTVSKTSLRGVGQGPGACESREGSGSPRGKDVHNMKAQPGPLTLLPQTCTGPNSQQNEFKRG